MSQDVCVFIDIPPALAEQFGRVPTGTAARFTTSYEASKASGAWRNEVQASQELTQYFIIWAYGIGTLTQDTIALFRDLKLSARNGGPCDPETMAKILAAQGVTLPADVALSDIRQVHWC